MGRSRSSDGDYSSANSDSDGEPVGRPENRPIKQKKKKTEVIPLAFDETWGKAQQLSIDLCNSKTAKNKLKLPWPSMFPSLKKHAGEIGFTLDELRILWKIVSFPSARINETQRRTLLMLLIPVSSIPGGFIEEVCLWAVESANSGKKSSVGTVVYLLKYLYGLVEYSLIEGDCFNKPFIYNMLFSLNSHKELVEWLFLLLSKVSTKDVIQRFHVQITSKLWKLDMPSNQKKAIVNVLKLFKVIRPDYLPDNVFAIHVNYKGRSAKLLDEFRELLIAAKRRMLVGLDGRGGDVQNFDVTVADDPSQVFHNNLFPDTCPAFCNHSWKDVDAKCVPRNSVIVWALLKTSRLGIFKTDGELLELLQSWLKINFLHKFTSYKMEQKHRYEFILNKCVEISEIVGHGLHVVDEWLPEFISMWDMVLWRGKILKLFSYMNIFEFSEFYGQILRKVEMDFLYSSVTESSQVWEALEHLLIRWVKLASVSYRRTPNAEVQEDQDEEVALISITNLYDFMFGLCTKYIAANLFDGVSEPLIIQMIDTFTKISELFIKTQIPFKPVIPEALFFSVILIDTTDVFDTFLHYLRIADTGDEFRDENDRTLMEEMRMNINNFFERGSKLCLSGLFMKELNLLDGREKNVLKKALQTWTAGNSKALEVFVVGQTREEVLYDLPEMEKIAPNLHWYVSYMQKPSSDFDNGDNKTAEAGNGSIFNPPYSSTPMPTHLRRK